MSQTPRAQRLLRTGTVHPFGRIPGASNQAFLVSVESANTIMRAVLKPMAGETPLYDFPAGSLAGREVAAYELAAWLGMTCIPPTVLRTDLGDLSGSLQAYVTTDGDSQRVRAFAGNAAPEDWEPVFSAETDDGTPVVVAHHSGARELALFDLLANNADRKGGHVFFGSIRPGNCPERVYGIDNGLCFHVDAKLRTVLWGFAGLPFTSGEQQMLDRAVCRSAELTERLASYVSPQEVEALQERAQGLRDLAAFPDLPDDRYPLPWPPL